MTEVTAVPLRPVGKGGVVALWIGVGLLLAGGIGAAWVTSRPVAAAFGDAPTFLAYNAKRGGVHHTASGLQYQVLKQGEGAARPTTSDLVQIDYVGKLTNGTEFDASPKGQPAVFPVGQVVPGFAEALQLMPKGAKYRVWLPPQLGYGSEQAGPIPANSVLMFDITLRDFRPAPPPQAGLPGSMPPGM